MTLRNKLIETVSSMDDAEIENVWHFVLSIKNKDSWDNIPEVKPDEWDMEMLKDIDGDPESKEYVSFEDAMRSLELDDALQQDYTRST